MKKNYKEQAKALLESEDFNPKLKPYLDKVKNKLGVEMSPYYGGNILKKYFGSFTLAVDENHAYFTTMSAQMGPTILKSFYICPINKLDSLLDKLNSDSELLKKIKTTTKFKDYISNNSNFFYKELGGSPARDNDILKNSKSIDYKAGSIKSMNRFK